MSALVLQIFSILAPSAILATIGLIWFHRGPPFQVEFVTTLVLNVGMPGLLFHTLATATVDISSLLEMGLATLVVHVVFASLAIALLKGAGKDWRLSVSHVVGNTGNLGLPICYFAFGDTGLAYAITFFSVQCLLLFSLGDGILAGRFQWSRILKSPILHSVWLGMTVRLLDWQLPAFVMDTTELVGQLVIPIMLITLGVSLAGMQASQLTSNVVWSGIRTLIAMSVGFGVAALMGLEGVARGVLVLETVVPVAVFNFLLAVRHGRDSTEVAGMILVTHLAAIVYLPLVLALVLLP